MFVLKKKNTRSADAANHRFFSASVQTTAEVPFLWRILPPRAAAMQLLYVGSSVSESERAARPAAVWRLLAFRLVPPGHRAAVGLPLGLREQGCAQSRDQQHSITQTATSFRHHHQRGPFRVVCVKRRGLGGGVCVGEIFMSGVLTHTHTHPCGCDSVDILSTGLWDGAVQFFSSSFLAPRQTPVSAPPSLTGWV